MTGDAVAVLERSLRGPRRARADMVREVRDGLDDAVEAHLAAGLSQDEAQRRALDEFGDMRAIAAELQGELTARYGRRSAVLLALAFPALTLLWDTLWLTDAVPMRPPAPAVALLADLIDTMSMVSAVCCVAGVLVLGVGARWGVPANRVTQGVGVLALCTLLGTVGTSLLMQFVNDDGGAMYELPPVLGVTAVNTAIAGWVIVTARRCLVLARAARPRDAVTV